MNNKLTRDVFGINKDHVVVMVHDKTWRSSEQTRMTLGRAAMVLQELGVESADLDGDESHEGWLARVKNLLSQPLTIQGKTFYIPPAPETTGVDPQWDWREIFPGWFEANADGKVYAVGLEVPAFSENVDMVEEVDVDIEVRLGGTRWITYWYLDTETSGTQCRKVRHQPRFGRLVEAQAWIEDIHEQGKDKSGIIGG